MENGRNATVTSQTILWFVTARWSAVSDTPAGRTDVRGVVSNKVLGNLTVASGSFYNASDGGLINVTLVVEDDYFVCVTAINDAGVASAERCSVPVHVGAVREVVQASANATLFLSPMGKALFDSGGLCRTYAGACVL